MNFDPRMLPTPDIDRCVTAAMSTQRIPGLSLAIGSGGHVLYSRGYGERIVPEKLVPNADTIFPIASISKQFAAAAILRLEARGLLHIDDPLSRYFTGIPYGDGITIRQLLTHTSGIPGYTEIPDFDRHCRQPATPDEIVGLVAQRAPAFAPGAQWQYGNTNYVILGRIVESVSGETFGHFLRSAFFEPLGLERTGVDDDLTTIRSNAARGYSAYALGELENAYEWHPSWKFATGGLFSTAADLVRWNAALRSGRVVAPADFARMSTTHRLLDGSATQYGLGLGVVDVAELHEVRHTGGLPGFSLDNTTYPELDLDIVVLANVDGISTYLSIVRRILALVLDRPELAQWTLPAVPRPVATTAQPPPPQSWIALARSGNIDDLPLSAAFARYLLPHRRAALRELAALGPLVAVELLERGRRDPDTSFTYQARFEARTLQASITVVDGGDVGFLGFREWDERQTTISP